MQSRVRDEDGESEDRYLSSLNDILLLGRGNIEHQQQRKYGVEMTSYMLFFRRIPYKMPCPYIWERKPRYRGS